jgi:uncharacterized protein YutE (UPF0331/DUF86 family)
VVDAERLHRILRRVAEDLSTLEGYAARPAVDVLADPAWLGHVKYLFVCVIEGAIDAAQHVGAAEGWGPPDTNADAIRVLGRHGVVDHELAERVASAVGFRNLLVHRYAEIDDVITVRHLGELDDLRRFVAAVSRLLDG